jgi:hypothetical protein
MIGEIARQEAQQMTPLARAGAAQRRCVSAARDRFKGSAAQDFFSRLGVLDFVNSIVLFGASLLLSVLPRSPGH